MLLTELRADFTIPWADIDILNVSDRRLKPSPSEAAREMGLAEDALVFYGTSANAGILFPHTIRPVSHFRLVAAGTSRHGLPRSRGETDSLGIKGPYEAVLSPHHYYSYLRQPVRAVFIRLPSARNRDREGLQLTCDRGCSVFHAGRRFFDYRRWNFTVATAPRRRLCISSVSKLSPRSS